MCRHGPHCNGDCIKIPNPPHKYEYPPSHPSQKTPTITFTYSDEEPSYIFHTPSAWNFNTTTSTRAQLISHAVQRGLNQQKATLLAERWFRSVAPKHTAIIRDLTSEEKAQEYAYDHQEPFSQFAEAEMRKAAANAKARENLKRVFPDNSDFEMGYRELLEKGWDPKEAEAFVIENYL